MNYLRREKGKLRVKRVLRVMRETSSHIGIDFYSDDGDYAKRLLRTRHPCSCPMCGNPRRHFGERTLQERTIDLTVDLEYNGV